MKRLFLIFALTLLGAAAWCQSADKYSVTPSFKNDDILLFDVLAEFRQEGAEVAAPAPAEPEKDKKAKKDKKSKKSKKEEENSADELVIAERPANFDLKYVLRFKFGTRKSAEKSMPVEIKASKPEMLVAGETLSMFGEAVMPTLTAIVKPDCSLSGLFGLRPEDKEVDNPGVVPSSLVMFLFCGGLENGRAEGEEWTYERKLPEFNQMYKFKSKLIMVADGTFAIDSAVTLAKPVKDDEGKVTEIIAPYTVTSKCAYDADDGQLRNGTVTVKNKEEKPMTVTYKITRQSR